MGIKPLSNQNNIQYKDELMTLGTLSENTKRIRRSLLTASLVGCVITMIDVSISKVTVFGTEFKIGNYQAIPIVLGLIISYYLITFSIYALSEYEHMYRKGKKEYLTTLALRVPVTLEEADDQIASLKIQLNQLKDEIRTSIIIEEIKSKEMELKKIELIKNYLKTTKNNFFDIFSFKKIYFVIELFFPIALALYACLLVFFFTEFNGC